MIIDQIDLKGSIPQNQKNEIGSIFHVFKTILYLCYICLIMSKLDPCLQSVSPTTSNSLNEEIDKQSVLDDQWIEDVGDSDRQSHLDDPFDWELEEPIDISIGSDASHDDSDLINESMSEFEIQEEDLREDVFDKIIDAFTVKRRKAIIDQEQDVDLVDYEESQRRLFILAIVSATILGITATTLLILQLPNWSFNQVVIYQFKVQQAEKRTTYPHIIVLFLNGEMEAFKQNGIRLEHSWTFQLPKVQNETGYLPYSELGQLFILNSNEAKNAILLSKSYSNLTHSIIPNSQIPQKFFYSPRFVQVGHQFWIFGGKRKMIKNGYEIPIPMFYKFGKQSNTLIWNTRRKVYYPGPDLSYEYYSDYTTDLSPALDYTLGRGLPISLNRTHVMILQVEVFSECLQGWIYSFSSFQWTAMDQCIYQLNTDAGSVDFKARRVLQEFEIKGASYYDKNVVLKTLVLINGYLRENGFATFSQVVLVEIGTLTATEIEHHFEVLSPSKIGIVSSQATIYFLCNNEEDGQSISAYILEGGLKLKYLQNLESKQTVMHIPTTFSNHIPNKFHVIFSLF